MHINVAKNIIENFKKFIKVNGKRAKVIPVGSVRRKKSNPSDIDLLVIKNPTDSLSIKIGSKIYKPKGIERVRIKESTIKGNLTNNGARLRYKHENKWQQVDIFCSTKEDKIYALFFLTGPKIYNIRIRATAKNKGLLLNQYGLFDRNKRNVLKPNSETDIQEFLGVKKRSPSQRESL